MGTREAACLSTTWMPGNIILCESQPSGIQSTYQEEKATRSSPRDWQKVRTRSLVGSINSATVDLSPRLTAANPPPYGRAEGPRGLVQKPIPRVDREVGGGLPASRCDDPNTSLFALN